MVQQVQTHLRDDLNPDLEATRTVRFGFEGDDYEIDLNEEHYGEMQARFYAYTIAGRKITRSQTSSRKRTRTPPERSAAMRAFARERGLKCGERGRIPGEVIRQFELASGS